MNKKDRTPFENSPVYGRIRARMNNRLGAVYSALYSFWSARQTAVGLQRDANTVILHAEGTQSVCENDKTRSPDELLDLLLPNGPNGGNNFDRALEAADAVISKWLDDARPPVIIFLSDGIASVSDSAVRKLFRKTAQKGCVVFNYDVWRLISNFTLPEGKDFRCMPSYLVRSRLQPGWSRWWPSHSMHRAIRPRWRVPLHPFMRRLIAYVISHASKRPWVQSTSYRSNSQRLSSGLQNPWENPEEHWCSKW